MPEWIGVKADDRSLWQFQIRLPDCHCDRSDFLAVIVTDQASWPSLWQIRLPGRHCDRSVFLAVIVTDQSSWLSLWQIRLPGHHCDRSGFLTIIVTDQASWLSLWQIRLPDRHCDKSGFLAVTVTNQASWPSLEYCWLKLTWVVLVDHGGSLGDKEYFGDYSWWSGVKNGNSERLEAPAGWPL